MTPPLPRQLLILEEGRLRDDPSMFDGLDRETLRVMLEHYGWIYLRRETEALSVCWNLREATEEALESAVSLLLWSGDPQPVLLNYKFGGWRRECLPNAVDAAARLSDLIPFRTLHPFTGTSVLPALEDPADDPGLCGRTFRALHRPGAQSTGSLFERLASERLGKHVVWFSLDEAKGDLRYRFIGAHTDCVRFFGRSWAQSAIDTRYDLDPAGSDYADRVCQPYLEVMETGVPRLDEIQALVEVPGAEPLWVPYHRLLARVGDRHGRPGLVLVTRSTYEPLPLLAEQTFTTPARRERARAQPRQ